MKLQTQQEIVDGKVGVVSLELAKKMKSLGFSQQSFWYWETDGCHNLHRFASKTSYSAYTAGELTQLLPYHLDLRITAYLHMVKISPTEYRVAYVDDFGVAPYDGQRLQFAGGSLHNNLASMAIYLAEKGLLDTKTLG